MDDFVFDLQRFAITDDGWNTSVDNPRKTATKLTNDDINGYDEADKSGHNIEVVTGSGNAQTKKYFDFMQSAMNYILGLEGATKTATVNVLDDIADGDPFTIGMGRDGKNASAVDVTIDLNEHEYKFAQPLTEGSSSTVSKAKAIQTTYNTNSKITIKNGTMSVAENATTKFERFMKNYVNLTLENFTLDGSSFTYNNAIEKSFDGSLICVSAGTVSLTGNTNITGVADGYYALGGKLATSGTYSGGLSIAVNTNGTIDNIAMYDWNTTDRWAADGDFSKGKLNIQKGTIGSVEYSERAVNTGAMAYTTIGTDASIGSVNGVSDYLAYAEIGATSSIYDNRSDSITGGILYAAGQVGWNDGSTDTKFNFVAASVGAADSLKAGQVVLGVDGVKSYEDLGYDATNAVVGIPTIATATWGTDSVTNGNYAVAEMTYNNRRDAVVLSTVSLGSAGGYAKLVAKDNATTAGLFAHSVKECCGVDRRQQPRQRHLRRHG